MKTHVTIQNYFIHIFTITFKNIYKKRNFKDHYFVLQPQRNHILSKVELVKIAPPFQVVEKTTNLLVNIHYFISGFLKTTN